MQTIFAQKTATRAEILTEITGTINRSKRGGPCYTSEGLKTYIGQRRFDISLLLHRNVIARPTSVTRKLRHYVRFGATACLACLKGLDKGVTAKQHVLEGRPAGVGACKPMKRLKDQRHELGNRVSDLVSKQFRCTGKKESGMELKILPTKPNLKNKHFR